MVEHIQLDWFTNSMTEVIYIRLNNHTDIYRGGDPWHFLSPTYCIMPSSHPSPQWFDNDSHLQLYNLIGLTLLTQLICKKYGNKTQTFSCPIMFLGNQHPPSFSALSRALPPLSIRLRPGCWATEHGAVALLVFTATLHAEATLTCYLPRLECLHPNPTLSYLCL